MKLGGGVLDLTGNNTYGGLTTVNAGVLVATSTSSLPGYLSAGNISVNNAGSGLVVQAGSNPGEFPTAGDVAAVLANMTFAAGTNFGIQVVGGESVVYNGTIPDATGGGLGFLKLGEGTLTLGGLNTYSGPTTISLGTVIAASSVMPGSAGAFGSSSAAISWATPTRPAARCNCSSAARIPSARTSWSVPTASPRWGTSTTTTPLSAATISLNSPLTIASASVVNTLTFGGGILNSSGTANSVTLAGPGNVAFNGVSTYSGSTTINAGALSVGATGALPNGNALTLNGASSVTFANSAQTLSALNGSASSALNFNGGGTTLTLGGGTFAGAINDNTPSGSSLVKNTTGLLVLSGPNGLVGTTTVNAGALLFGSVASVPTYNGPGRSTSAPPGPWASSSAI